MSPLAIVGDVHGDAVRLEKFLGLYLHRERHTIFVGDYVNRGPDSARVLDLLLSASTACPQAFTFLKGNHDAALLRYYESGHFAPFAAQGRIATIRSYTANVSRDVAAAVRRAFPRRHV